MTFRPLLPAFILTLIVGCHTQDIGQVGERPREAISYASLAKYPGPAQGSGRYSAVAITDPLHKELTLYNLGSESIPATAVWVNGDFVKQIAPISPKSHLDVKYVELLQAGPGAKPLTELERIVQKVELQTSDGTYSVQGPVDR